MGFHDRSSCSCSHSFARWKRIRRHPVGLREPVRSGAVPLARARAREQITTSLPQAPPPSTAALRGIAEALGDRDLAPGADEQRSSIRGPASLPLRFVRPTVWPRWPTSRAGPLTMVRRRYLAPGDTDRSTGPHAKPRAGRHPTGVEARVVAAVKLGREVRMRAGKRPACDGGVLAVQSISLAQGPLVVLAIAPRTARAVRAAFTVACHSCPQVTQRHHTTSGLYIPSTAALTAALRAGCHSAASSGRRLRNGT